jgi:hypothetical protein
VKPPDSNAPAIIRIRLEVVFMSRVNAATAATDPKSGRRSGIDVRHR